MKTAEDDSMLFCADTEWKKKGYCPRQHTVRKDSLGLQEMDTDRWEMKEKNKDSWSAWWILTTTQQYLDCWQLIQASWQHRALRGRWELKNEVVLWALTVRCTVGHSINMLKFLSKWGMEGIIQAKGFGFWNALRHHREGLLWRRGSVWGDSGFSGASVLVTNLSVSSPHLHRARATQTAAADLYKKLGFSPLQEGNGLMGITIG